MKIFRLSILRISLFFISFLGLVQFTFSQSSELELEKIMAGNDFIGHQPYNINWSSDGSEIFFRWKHNVKYDAPYFSYNIASKKYKQLSGIEAAEKSVDGFTKSEVGKSALYKKGNVLYREEAGQIENIYSTFKGYRIVRFLSHNSVVISLDGNLFHIQEDPMRFTQLTNFVDGKNPASSEERNFLENQQRELFEIVRLNDSRDSAAKEFRDAHRPKTIKPFHKNKRTIAWSTVSDKLNFVVFRSDEYPDNKRTHIESYVTSSGQSKSESARAKIGKEDPNHKLYVWNLKEDTVHLIDFSSLSGITTKPAFLKDYDADLEMELSAPKNIIIHSHGFNSTEEQLMVEVKSYDNKDRWIALIDLESMSVTEIDHQHDDAWIGGPGIHGWNSVRGTGGWINENEVYYQSEKSGYSHLYKYNLSTKKTNALTEGKWEVHQAELSMDRAKLYITANKNHPGNREFYSLDIKSTKLTPILTSDGNHDVEISPDEKWLAVRYSYKNKPWELYIAPLEKNATMTQITDSQSKEFKSYQWRDVELTKFTATDGIEVPARIYRPTAEAKNGAAVIFVHGAGYLQNAHNWWSGYYREYMFNNMLCDMGYTVLDIDYRASKGYGRDWRTSIYRFMGGADLSDHVDGRQFLIDTEGIEPNKVGMYGGSYGGFITLMALLTEPGKFKCGAAIRSVTDWAHYNHEYTSNILNTPETDPDAFKKSSPIYFAENLQDKLIMLHGIEDDNVQYQDVVRISQRFIELGKKDWDLIGYPIEPHGFKETSSWVDEYGRILELFESQLK